MRIQLRFFATLRDHFQSSDKELEVASGVTAREVFLRLFSEPKLAEPLLVSTRFAVNWEYVSPATVLHEGDELAFIPPVSGG